MSCWSFLMSVYVFLIVMFSKQVAENSWYFLHAYAWLLATITTATMYISEAVNRKGAVMGDATFECWISAAYPELRVGLLYAHLWFHFAVLVGMYMFIFWKLKSLKDDVGSIGKSGTGGAGGTDGGDVEGGGGVASRKTSRAASLGAASLGGISLGAGSLGGSNYGVTFDAMPTNLPTTIQKKVFEVSRKNSVTTASHQVRRKSSVGTGAGIGRLPKLIIVKKSSNKKLVMKASLIALGFIVCWTPPAAVRILGLTPVDFFIRRNHDEEYEAIPNSPTHVNLIAGAIAGITEHTLMFPFDSIKTRMQMITTNPAAIYSSITNAVSRISSAEGATALWRGVNSVVLGAGPAHALSFGVYEHFKVVFGADLEGSGLLRPAIAGACSTIAHDGLMTPFDVIKQRLQLSSGSQFSTTLACAKQILRTEGIQAFYVSYPTTLAMNIPFHMIHFSTYEAIKKRMNPCGRYDPFTHCVAGGVAGGLAAGLTTPLDVVKTLLQTRGVSEDSGVQAVRGFVGAVRLVAEREGTGGFFKGLGARVLTNVPATAISWTTYEFLK
ncbi:Fe(2+) transporter, partial [Physocladia obscura]